MQNDRKLDVVAKPLLDWEFAKPTFAIHAHESR
jgi:hypothetical protein